MRNATRLICALGATLSSGVIFAGNPQNAPVKAVSSAQLNSSTKPASPAQYAEVVNKFCVGCHNDKAKTGGLTLQNADLVNIVPQAETWEKVIRKLRTSAMPPAGRPRPDKATYDSLAGYLETTIDSAAKPDALPSTIHRLNRAEYANSVRDLLGVEIDGAAYLPPDDAGYGFDNIADVLTVSPTLLERYMSAAVKISRLATGDPTIRPSLQTYQVPDAMRQEDRMSEELPFGTRGGIVARHLFPLDGEYVITVLLQRTRAGYVRGLDEARQLDIRLDGVKLKTFTVGGQHYGKSGPIFSNNDDLGDPKQEKYERHDADVGLEVRIPVKAGLHEVAAAFQLADVAEEEGVLEPQLKAISAYKGGEPYVGSVVIGGPYDAKVPAESLSRKKIFICRPIGEKDDEPCVDKILLNLARHAYRRPSTAKDLETLLAFYKQGWSTGGVDDGMRAVLERVLVDLEFLFRIEPEIAKVAPGKVYPISGLDLASRLSFFLWSSIPDEELLSLGERGQLSNPVVLKQQIRRMLHDERSNALVENFFGQWLLLRNVSAATPDLTEFPLFDENLRAAFREETDLFLKSMLREDHPVMDLLDADYTFVNERLARHYGIPNVYGNSFRRVTQTDPNRRGLLGQGSILTVTSYATRTSVVLRGKWLLENILGSPPPPPPPNVPALKDRADDGSILSVRQQMELHRANAVCASCHSRMDPLGFALENFNAIGGWRDTESSAHTPIDASGTYLDGSKFNGAAELRKVLLAQRQQIVTTAVEKLLTYALGRGVDYRDEPTIRKIMRQSEASDYRWSSLIEAVVESEPFRMRVKRNDNL